ncbi:MAG: iron ABC transporter substrate-binding protein [Clostridiales bacterium]|nr:MAG: iron ABC transporter substrate-binding protein [Clostridiales bacterium]
MKYTDKKLLELMKDKVIRNELIKDNVIKDDDKLIEKLGNILSLKDLLSQKGFDIDEYEKKINLIKTNSHKFDVTLNTDITNAIKVDADVVVKGILPCPVRVPLMEKIAKFKNENKDYFKTVSMQLNPASMGLDWLKESLSSNDENDIPDLFVSAGFDVFFDKKYIGKFVDREIFEDMSSQKEYAEIFASLKDPKSAYSVMAVVPAVFIVNEKKLNGRKFPNSWEDLLSSDFEDSVALPLHDFDLFNAVLLGIYKLYGEEGIVRLAKNFKVNLHPSQMIKTARENNDIAISVMPYFFTNMAKSPLKSVWPLEGAIISPIFLLAKKSKRDKVKPLVDLFTGDDIANILANGGFFPSVNKNVQNRLFGNETFVFPGWEFLNDSNPDAKLKELVEIFNRNKN